MQNTERERANDLNSLFEQIKSDILSYVNHRLAHYRLDILEKTSKYSSVVLLTLIMVFMGFAAFAFALIGIALYIGEVVGSTAAGFGIVALFWLVLLVIVLIFKEPLKDYILNKAAGQLYQIEKEEDHDEAEEE